MKLKCKIADVKRVSPYNFEYLVSVEFNDGEKKWHKPYKIDLGHIPSLAEFKEQLRFVDPNPETTQDLLEEQVDTEFDIEFVPKREN